VRAHLCAGLDYQSRLARFMENHDEPRAAEVFARDVHQAAAIVTYLSPGLRFFHQGQFEGRRTRISPHLVRAPQEVVDEVLRRFYERLLFVLKGLAFRDGAWRLVECVPAWEHNWTSDCFVASLWTGRAGERKLVVVNYAGNQSQCYVRVPSDGLNGAMVRFTDLTGSAGYDRESGDVATRGLYLDLRPWGYHVFDVSAPADAERDDWSTRTPAADRVLATQGR
jgi:hypothetical protein